MMLRKGFPGVVVYLDNFLVVAPTKAECDLAFTTLSILLTDLGFQISPTKVVPPVSNSRSWGLLWTPALWSSPYPQDKLRESKQLIDCFASKLQLQQLAGKLNWACGVIHGGPTFLRRIIDCMNKLLSNNAKYLLTPEFRQDIFWWQRFLCVLMASASYIVRSW